MGEAGQRRIREMLAWQYSVPSLLKIYDDLASHFASSQMGQSQALPGSEDERLLPAEVSAIATVSEQIPEIKSAPRDQ